MSRRGASTAKRENPREYNTLCATIRGVPRASRTSRSRGAASPISLDGQSLTLEQVEAIADGRSCTLAPTAERAVRRSRDVVERALASGDQIYGVNTGFGHLAGVRIADADLAQLQTNLVRSHAAGVGAPLDARIVRAILALRANCLARGHSGVRVETLRAICALLEAGVCPLVPEQGSVAASGDLAPLAHVALTLIGEGEALRGGERIAASEALRKAGLRPLSLAPKEGLALINGTQVTAAIGTLALLAGERAAVAADIVGAMTLEALRGSHRAFAQRIHAARPQPGQLVSAANLRKLLGRSEIVKSHAECGKVQDAYSLRCMPQVHGAVRDGLAYVRRVLEIEINSSTDNPMVFAETGELVSGGNFHGQPVALALDSLAIAVATLGTISERRIERLLNPHLSELPAFLTADPGLHSGFMLAHVTAAALVSENKVLAHPASVDSIPTSAAKEDHVPMGTHAARKAARIVEHVTTILGIEALCAAQALDLLRPLVAGAGAEAARRAVRRHVAHLDEDRVLATDIERAKRLVVEQDLRRAAEQVVGPLR
jgi:histidine ammonia-lyase